MEDKYSGAGKKKLFAAAIQRACKVLTAIFLFCMAGGLSASNYYWIGGTGNWDDLTHWATTSGGTTLHNQIPTAMDDVFFDANSFTSAGRIVTLNTLSVLCHNMSWSGAVNSPTMTGTGGNTLKIYGSLTLIPGMTYSFSGPISFEATATGNTIDCGGKSFTNSIVFNGIGGGWTLLGALNTSSSISHNNGILDINGQTVSASSFSSSTSTTRSLSLGAAVINLSNITSCWTVTSTGMTSFNAGTSTINCTNNSGWSPSFSGGGYTYYILNFTGPTSTGIINNNNTFNGNVTFSGAATINNNNIFNGTTSLGRNGSITNNNTFNNLTLTPAYTYTLTVGRTQTITGTLTAAGNCGGLIAINSSAQSSQSTISHPAGAVNVSYVNLKDIIATGGATFTAVNSIDLGNNVGWNITGPIPKDLYWIGNSGLWSDGNHWSLTSGGGPSGCSPTPVDNVFFNGPSFSLAGQTMTIDVPTAYCNNMTWTGVVNTPTFACTNLLKIFGSLTLASGMTLSYSGPLNFEAITTGKTITSAGKTFGSSISFNGIGGGWTLLDAFSTNSSISHNNGALYTNAQTVNASSFSSSTSNTRSLDIGSSTINLSNITSCWTATTTGMTTFNAALSTINCTNNSGWSPSFSGGGLTYHNLNFTGPTSTGIINNNNTFNGNVIFSGTATINNNNVFNGNTILYGHGSITNNNTYNNLLFTALYTYTLTSARTQTINGTFTAMGNCGGMIAICSGTPGSQSTISHPAGTVTVDYIIFKDIAATGGATFTANNSIDMGNTTGWNITGPVPQNLYWIGNGGLWSNGNHWSLTSGGSPSGCSPNPVDNVFFDANSFSLAGQTVTIDVPTAYCNSMTWTGTTNTPTFASTNTLKIYGSLTFVPGMTLSFSGPVNFNATSTGKTITSAGKNFGSSIAFNGIGGGWTLLDGFSTNSSIAHNNGALYTNGKTVNASSFSSSSSTTRSLDLDTSSIYLSNITSCWTVTTTAMTLFDGDSSKIFCTNNSGWSPSFSGGGYTYNILNFTGPTSTGIINNNNTFNGNVTFSGTATINNNNVFNATTTLLGNGSITNNNTFFILTFSPGYTYTITNGRTQTILDHWNIQGSCTSYIILQSSTAGSFSTFTKANGAVTGYNLHIRDIKCTGGATFFAYNSVDLGGNSGWSFQALAPLGNPQSINGLAGICPGQGNINYYIHPVPGAISYNWTVPSGATIVTGQGDTLITINFGALPGGVITVTAYSGCAYSSQSTITVTNNIAAFAAVNPSCINASPFQLTTGSPAGGTYGGPGVNNGIFSPALAGIGTHTISYFYSNGICTDTAFQTISVYAQPSVTFSAIPDVCTNTPPFALSGGGPSGGTYSGYGVNNGNFNPAVAGLGLDTITYTYTDNHGCSGSATQTINVVNGPGSTLSPPGPLSICQGGSVSLSASAGAGLTYQWQNNGLDISGAQSQTYTATTDGNYNVITTNSCGSDTSNTVAITFMPNPTLPTIPSGPSAVCTGITSSVYYTSSNYNLDYFWTITPPAAGSIAGNGPAGTVTWTSGYSGYATISVASYSNCDTTAWVSTTVSVGMGPGALAAITGPASLCTGTLSSYATSSAGATSFNWTVNPAGAGTINNLGDSATVSWNPLFAGNVVLSVTASNACGTTAAQTMNIVLDTLIANLIFHNGAGTVCQGTTSSTYTANCANATGYIWTLTPPAAGSIAGNGNTATVTWNPAFTGTCSVSVQAYNNCDSTNTATLTVTVAPLPATPTITVNGYDLTSSPANGYTWYLNGGQISGATAQTYTAVATGDYFVVVSNAYGCKDTSAIVHIDVQVGIEEMAAGADIAVYPNPFTDQLNINVTLKENAEISVELYNSLGQRAAAIILNKQLAAGEYTFTVNRDEQELAEGVYLLRVTVDSNTTILRVIRMDHK